MDYLRVCYGDDECLLVLPEDGAEVGVEWVKEEVSHKS